MELHHVLLFSSRLSLPSNVRWRPSVARSGLKSRRRPLCVLLGSPPLPLLHYGPRLNRTCAFQAELPLLSPRGFRLNWQLRYSLRQVVPDRPPALSCVPSPPSLHPKSGKVKVAPSGPHRSPPPRSPCRKKREEGRRRRWK